MHANACDKHKCLEHGLEYGILLILQRKKTLDSQHKHPPALLTLTPLQRCDPTTTKLPSYSANKLLLLPFFYTAAVYLGSSHHWYEREKHRYTPTHVHTLKHHCKRYPRNTHERAIARQMAYSCKSGRLLMRNIQHFHTTNMQPEDAKGHVPTLGMPDC
jgi:hypothetical protein